MKDTNGLDSELSFDQLDSITGGVNFVNHTVARLNTRAQLARFPVMVSTIGRGLAKVFMADGKVYQLKKFRPTATSFD